MTGVWFLFNGKDTTQTRDCYARVEYVALRFVEEDNRRIRIRKLTENVGDWALMAGLRGSEKKIFGYQLDEAGRREVVDKKFRLLGMRIQFQVRRGSNGTTRDTIQGGIDALRFSIGDASNRTIRDDTKRALVGAGNEMWSTFSTAGGRLRLEGRP